MKRFWLSLLTGAAIALTGLAGCAAPQSAETASPDLAGSVSSSADSTVAQTPESAVERSSNNSEQPTEDRSASRPQLIKKASLNLRVDSIEESIQQVREIVQEQQGDVLSLSDRSRDAATSTGADNNSRLRQEATLFELRVPQDRFDSAVDKLAAIGELEDRSISTEDVSSQLVDLQARISNSQQSETALKEIMSRSGEIADVLEVSKELSRVRQEIEQMKAAQQNLQTQVRYSTIRVSLESAIAQTPSQPAFTTQLANTWKTATASVGSFTTDLLQLGLWLLVYSPYLAILLVGAAIARKVLRSAAD